MKKGIGIVLLLAAVCLGYMGVQKWNDGSNSLSIGKLEISADNKSTKQEAYFYLGGAALLLLGGIFTFKKKG